LFRSDVESCDHPLDSDVVLGTLAHVGREETP
jgi:hypothetical protein